MMRAVLASRAGGAMVLAVLGATATIPPAYGQFDDCLPGIISTLAGNGEEGYSGDGGLAAQAGLALPTGVAMGPDGCLYLADMGNHRIRKICDGRITTVAGKDTAGYSGDGGPAAQASLNEPRGCAAGADGSLYIADTKNHCIRKVDRAGIISTVAGRTGRGRYYGDGGPASEARLNEPYGVTVDADGSLYIADTLNHRIRKVDPDGVITAVAGTGGAGSWGDGGAATGAAVGRPRGVAMGADGSLYFADAENHRIRKIRWLPCDLQAARTMADDLRAGAGGSPDAWREVAQLYLILEAYDDALAAAERVLAVTPESREQTRMRAEVLIARVHAAKRDDHEARRRLIRVLARARDPLTLRDAADILVDLYLSRGERDQAIATLSELTVRTQDRNVVNWVDQRLRQITGG